MDMEVVRPCVNISILYTSQKLGLVHTWCPGTGARARAQNAAMFRLLVPKMYVCSHSINRAHAHCIQTARIATCMHFVFDIAV